MADPPAKKPSFLGASFRKFFGRGLGIVLPTVLTAWLVVIAYQFVDERIAQPINHAVRVVILELTDAPEITDADYASLPDEALPPNARATWARVERQLEPGVDPVAEQTHSDRRVRFLRNRPQVDPIVRRHALEERWNRFSALGFPVADLLGILIAIVLVYFAGVLLSNFLGRRLYAKGEELIQRVPLVGRVYPSVKQVTDFFFGEKDAQISFNRVVAVQYPRKGLWSVGLVTGSTMRRIQDEAGDECLTVFVPSSPTPFTGYVITVPVNDTIDLSVTIEDALKFAVSGGVLIPPSQQIDQLPAAALRVEPGPAVDTPEFDGARDTSSSSSSSPAPPPADGPPARAPAVATRERP